MCFHPIIYTPETSNWYCGFTIPLAAHAYTYLGWETAPWLQSVYFGLPFVLLGLGDCGNKCSISDCVLAPKRFCWDSLCTTWPVPQTDGRIHNWYGTTATLSFFNPKIIIEIGPIVSDIRVQRATKPAQIKLITPPPPSKYIMLFIVQYVLVGIYAPVWPWNLLCHWLYRCASKHRSKFDTSGETPWHENNNNCFPLTDADGGFGNGM